jgi:hypothetical protein
VLSFSAAKISRVYIPDLGVTENLSLVFLTPSYSSLSIYLTDFGNGGAVFIDGELVVGSD